MALDSLFALDVAKDFDLLREFGVGVLYEHQITTDSSISEDDLFCMESPLKVIYGEIHSIAFNNSE